MTAAQQALYDGLTHHRNSRSEVQVAPHRRPPRLRLRDWRIRTKLATIVAIPSIAFVALAAVQVGASVGQATVLSDFAAQVAIGEQITMLVHELQQERDRTVGELAERQVAPNRYDAISGSAALRGHYDAVDRSIVEFRTAAAGLAQRDAAWRAPYTRAIETVDQLPALRTAVANGSADLTKVFDGYGRAIEALVALLAEPGPRAEQSELADAVSRYVQLARIKEVSSQIRARIYLAARAGRFTANTLAELGDLRSQQYSAVAEYRTIATLEQVQRYQAMTEDPRFRAAQALEEEAVGGAGSRPAVPNAMDWWALSQDRHQLLRTLEQEVLGDAIDQVEGKRSAQLRRTLLVVVVVLVVLCAAAGASLIVGRSIVRSLRALRNQALQVAQSDLPEALERLRNVPAEIPEITVPPAAVQSMDEVGEVAEAFVAVHRSAISVAREQAAMRRNVNAMFINLARRSQVLVERQLEILDELKREASSHQQMEKLLKVDRLAARLRRNDENLLVLAGSEATRRWVRPVGLPAIMLAAIAEIEQYSRVQYEAPEQPHVVGHAVGDLVHLLAELLENAIAFSPPYTTVRMTARVEPGSGVIIEVADEGLGVTEETLAELNAVLANPPAADVATAERMGLVVVSHLAARHGIRVRLHTASRGVIAVVEVPKSLIVTEPSSASERRALPTRSVAVPSAGQTAARAVAVAREFAAIPEGERDLPVAGRRPDPVPSAVPRPRQPQGGLSGDSTSVAGTGGPNASPSVWWTRSRAATSDVDTSSTSARAVARLSPSGLPMRVPMAALPLVTESASVTTPAPNRHEADPEAVGATLSRFYRGVRRAENEEARDMSFASPDWRGEGKKIGDSQQGSA